MPIEPDRTAYFKSLADELLSQANRMRNLIGDKHWLTDGHHKEYLLTTLLERHLPSGMLASRGFVVDPRFTELCSREQDILIVDTSLQGPLFNQGGTVIALPRSVVGAISVKSTLTTKSLEDTIENQNSV